MTACQLTSADAAVPSAKTLGEAHMWLGSIWNAIKALGTTSIEVYEWDLVTVQKKRLGDAPNFATLTTQRANLQFRGWDLAHAVVKADFLDERNLTIPGIAFLLQVDSILKLGASPIALADGASAALNDVSLSSLAGRAAQGISILYAQSLGLTFVGHLRSHVLALPPGSPGLAYAKKAMADFLFVDSKLKKRVLVESKGSFSSMKNDPTAIKSTLKTSLERQIDPWMGRLNPPPNNGYVIYSCIREQSWAPSALFVVDPEGEQGEDAEVPLTTDQVIRMNYAGWLRAMGLPAAAMRLLRPPSAPRAQVSAIVRAGVSGSDTSFKVEEAENVEFLVQVVEGRRFAFRSATLPRSVLWEPWVSFGLAVGIDIAVLDAISKAIENPGKDLEVPVNEAPNLLANPDTPVSIFPDGTLFGSVEFNVQERLVFRL